MLHQMVGIKLFLRFLEIHFELFFFCCYLKELGSTATKKLDFFNRS